MQNAKKYWYLWIFFATSLILLVRKLITGMNKQETQRTPQPKLLIVTNNLQEYSSLSKYVYSMMQFECANFTSALWKSSNNATSMRFPTKRPSDNIGKSLNGQYSRYKDLEQCTRDLVLYFRYFNYPYQFQTLRQFVEFMKSKGYFTADLENYYRGVKTYYTKL